MGWRHDVYYKLIVKTGEGTTHDAMTLINEHLTLDETSRVTIKPCLYLKPPVEGQPDYIEHLGQRGALVTIEFTTVHKYGWKSVVYDSAAKWIEAETHDVFLLSMTGDNELAMIYGVENFKQELPAPPPPPPPPPRPLENDGQIIAMLQARAAAAKALLE